MNDDERLQLFKQRLHELSQELGIQIAIIRQIGNVYLDEPVLGFIVLPQGDLTTPSV